MIDKYDAPEGCIAVKQENCKECIFNKSGGSLTKNCINNDTIHGCFSTARKDGISVIFVKQETPDSSTNNNSIELYDGKYKVEHNGKGKLTVYRNGIEWLIKGKNAKYEIGKGMA